jgi:AraC-like DNA-binding protein
MFIIGISTFSELILVVFSMLLLLKKSPTQRANRFLAMAFICMAAVNVLMLYLYYALSLKSVILLSFYFPFGKCIVMLIGPALYFYLFLLFENKLTISFKKIGVHTLVVLPSLAYIIYFATLPALKRIGILMGESISTDWMVSLLNALFYIQSGIYLLICFRKISKQCESATIHRSNRWKINVRWLHYFFIFMLAGLLIYIPFCSFHSWTQNRIVAGMLIIDMLIIYLFVQSLWHTGLSMQNLLIELPIADHKLVINDKLAENYWNKLLDVLDSSKIYLSNECSLKNVALCADIPLHHLSRLINSYSNQNFSNFINKYRIGYACLLLHDVSNSNLTLEAIGHMCGFGSRVNFHNAFKKFTGKTPAEYLTDQQRNNDLAKYPKRNA